MESYLINLSSLSLRIYQYLLGTVDKKTLVTSPTKTTAISAEIDGTLYATRKALVRFKKNLILESYEYKSGHYGYTRYKLNEIFYKFFKKKYKYIYNNNNKENITIIKKREEVKSNLENHGQKTKQDLSTQKIIKYEELPEEWKEINYHLLEDYHFKSHHIVNFYKMNLLEPEVVQESINHFAFGIKHNPDSYAKYTDPLKVFIGRLRKGEPWIESTYKSQKAIAIEDLIIRRKEEKRKVADETCNLVDRLERDSYDAWSNGLKEEERLEIRKEHALKEGGIYDHYNEKILKLHFAKSVMDEYKDPKELALAEFIKRKEEREGAESARITEMLTKGGMMVKYYKWIEKLSEEEIKEITGEERGEHGMVTKESDKKLKKEYVKRILEK